MDGHACLQPARLSRGCPGAHYVNPGSLKRCSWSRGMRLHYSSQCVSGASFSRNSQQSCSRFWGCRAGSSATSATSLPISQQSLNMAFHLLDGDNDGLISRAEAHRMIAFYLALQQYKPPEPAARPLTWDQHLIASATTAGKLSGGRAAAAWAALEAFVAAKMSGGLQKHPPLCSDLVWAGLGMGTAFLALGLLAAVAKSLPVVGHWHQHGLPLLLGSFGTIAILLFGKPEADAVQLWPILAGQLGATAIAVSMLQVFGSSLTTRACAMAATVMYMMYTDSIHPPGGALVLMSLDNAAIQQFSWAYMLWPSLLLCLGVMLPISAATNWLRRNRQFDWPGSSNPAVTMRQKEKEYNTQQQKKADLLQRHAAMMLTDRVFVPLTQQLAAQMRGTVFRLAGLSKAIADYQKKQSLEKQWKLWQKQDTSDQDSGNVSRCGPVANTDGSLSKRPWKEHDRRLADEMHRKLLWGPAAPSFTQYEDKLQKLHEERLKQQQQQQQDSEHRPAPQQSTNKAAGGSRALNSIARVSSCDDQHWQQHIFELQRHLYTDHHQQQECDKPPWMYRWRSDIATAPGVGDFGYGGGLDSFAPDDDPHRA